MPPARGEDALHLNVARIHEPDKVLHDYVDTILMEIAVIAEREEVEFEAFALDHILARNVAYDYSGKVGLPCLGAERCKFGTMECDEIFVFGMLVLECFKHLGCIIVGIDRRAVAQKCHSRQFLLVSAHVAVFCGCR